MMKRITQMFIFIIVLICLATCKDDEILVITDEEFGYNYFPLEIGKFREYRLQTVTYNAVGEAFPDTTYMREEFISTGIDAEGDTIFTAAISEKNELDAPWIQTGFAIEQRDNTRAIRSIDNFRFIRMTFPVVDGVEWDGLIFIDNTVEIPFEGENIAAYQGWSQHQYVGGSSTLTLNDLQFDDVVTVIETNEEGITDLRESSSIYARNVGLVARTQRILGITCNGADDPCYNANASWESQAEAGYTLTQEIIAHN